MTFSLAWRNVTRSRYRSFLLILGILLTVALETGIAVSVDTLYDDFLLENRNNNYTDITVNPVTWQDSASLEVLAKEVRQISGVSKASPALFLSVNQFISQQVSQNVLVYGIDPKNHPDMAHLDLISGSRTLQSDTIIISEHLSTVSGFQVGDSVDLSSIRDDLNILRVTIGGIISDKSCIGNKIGFLFILVDFQTLLRVIPEGLRSHILIQEIDVSVKDLLRINGIAEKIEDKVGLNNYVFVEKDISEIKSAGIRAYQTAMNLVIIASFVVEFLFITNILAIAIKDRQKELGILRATGANSWQFIKFIGVEVLIYAIIGSTFGIFVGIGFSQILVDFMDNYYTSIEFQSISLHFSSIFATFLSGIIVALISGLYPIFLAQTLPVVQNIHSRMTTAKSHNIFTVTMWKYTIGSGVSLAITAFILQIFIGPSRFLDFSLLSAHFLTVVMIFSGTLLIEIGILAFLPRIAMRVLFWFDIITRTISIRNIAREFQKSLFTIMTAALALTFIIIVGTVSAAIIEEVPDYFQSQWGSIDAIVEARDDNLLPINSTQLLEKRGVIAKAAFIQETRTQIDSTNGYIYGVDPTQYSFFAEPILTSDYDLPSYLILNASTTNTINGLVSQILFQQLRSPLGSSVLVKIADNSTVNVTLAAVIKANIFLGSGEYLYISSGHFQDYFNSTMAKWFLCKQSGESASIEGAIKLALPEIKEITMINSIAELVEETLLFQSAIFQVLFIESFVLAAIAQFVCILMSTLRMEREMGIMRSLGLSKEKVFSIFMCESTALGITSLIVGFLDGFLGSILLIWYISQSIPITFYLPLERVAFWVGVSFLITIASTIVPSYRSSQKNVVATIYGRPMRKSYIEKIEEPIFFEEEELLPQRKRKEVLTVYDEPKEYQTSFQIGKSLLKANKQKIRNIFVVLLAVCLLNYILDSYLPHRGLIPFDLITSSFFSGGDFMFQYYSIRKRYLILLNPLLFFMGLALISPISTYLSDQKKENYQLTIRLLKSLLEGFFLMMILVIIGILLLISPALIYLFITTIFNPEGFYYTDDLWFYTVSFLNFGIELILFQRVWVFLVLRGLKLELNFKETFALTRNTAFEGQLGFITLLIIHTLIQIIITMIFRYPIARSSSISFSQQLFFPPLHPISFLALMSFEIGFFVILIIYQHIQLKKQLIVT